MNLQDAIDELKKTSDEAQAAQLDAIKTQLTPETPAVDTGLLARASALFRRKVEQVQDRVARSAELQFDSHAGQVVLGMRGGTLGDRHLLFHADGYDVDMQLSVDDSAESGRIIGQLLTENDTQLDGIEVRLDDDRSRITDELGRFTFSDVPTGDHTVTLHLPEQELSISLNAADS